MGSEEAAGAFEASIRCYHTSSRRCIPLRGRLEQTTSGETSSLSRGRVVNVPLRSPDEDTPRASRWNEGRNESDCDRRFARLTYPTAMTTRECSIYTSPDLVPPARLCAPPAANRPVERGEARVPMRHSGSRPTPSRPPDSSPLPPSSMIVGGLRRCVVSSGGIQYARGNAFSRVGKPTLIRLAGRPPSSERFGYRPERWPRETLIPPATPARRGRDRSA